ncbi:hypothetical protein KUF71_022792 [Frankliniella fusca]|uniref:Uncharacterized protein n=1 Tax=Frankliniella fusca TaxID=407009 RepID=A0AAE1LBA8_9NEOP|nr:hypothetical protein KUF71_022792 [Frankliniella fusca]
MDIIKRRQDSSSEDSDDVIPPTPAAKSTPLVLSNRLRKQSSSSDSSSSGGQIPTPRFPVHTAKTTENDSSSDEDEGHVSLPLHPLVNMKQEPRDSSSEEEDNQQRTVFQGQIINRLNSSRPAHTMSSSDDSDENTTSVNNHALRTNESSSESDEEEPPRLSVPAIIQKTERPSSSGSSEDSSDDDGAIVQRPGNQVPINNPGNSSSDEEPSNEPQKPLRNEDTSSEESETEDRNTVVRPPAPANDSSSEESDEEPERKPVVNRKSIDYMDSDGEPDAGAINQTKSLNVSVQQNQNIDSDSNEEETSDEEERVKLSLSSIPVSHQQKDSSEEETSDEEERVKLSLSSIPVSHQQKDSSEEETSDEEERVKEPLSSIPVSHQQKDSSEEETSDEEERVKEPLSSMPIPHQPKDSSDEESSDGEDARTFQPNSTLEENSQLISQDSSEKGSSSENGEQIFTSTQRTPSEDTIGGLGQWQPLSGIFSQSTPVLKAIERIERRQPASLKVGKSLLKETFNERERIYIQDALLTTEDLGSDDEIWLLQCPKSMDVNALKKQYINLASDSEIQLEDGPSFKRFSISPEQHGSNTINCVLPLREGNKFQISSHPVKGKVVVQEHIHVPKLRMPEASAKAPVPFPTGLKVRHPLLGVGFEEHIAKAKLALKEGERYNKQQKKIRRKEEMRRNTSGIDYSEESVLSPSFNQNVSKHPQSSDKKKIKDVSLQKTPEEESGKKRKKNISYSSDTAYSSEAKSFDGSFLGESKKKKHKKSNKDEVNGNNHVMEARTDIVVPSWHVPLAEAPVSVLDNSASVEKKKKKKSKHDLLSPSDIKQERLVTEYANGISETFINETSFSKKRKRKEAAEALADVPIKKKKHSV